MSKAGRGGEGGTDTLAGGGARIGCNSSVGPRENNWNRGALPTAGGRVCRLFFSIDPSKYDPHYHRHPQWRTHQSWNWLIGIQSQISFSRFFFLVKLMFKVSLFFTKINMNIQVTPVLKKSDCRNNGNEQWKNSFQLTHADHYSSTFEWSWSNSFEKSSDVVEIQSTIYFVLWNSKQKFLPV